jgi:DNA topoisomerase-3
MLFFNRATFRKKIKKSVKFSMIKVTDHHAVVTGFSLTCTINSRYMTLLQSGLLLFCDDCSVAILCDWKPPMLLSTTGNGTKDACVLKIPTKEKKADLLPDFIGEKASTLVLERTKRKSVHKIIAGHGNRRRKQVDDEVYAVDENSIGRPSTRADIIETLFKRQYIVNKTQVLPGDWYSVGLVPFKMILVKSAELAGSWRKPLKILKGTFTAAAFISNMKRMVDALVYEVRSETTRVNISHVEVFKNKIKTKRK